MEENLIQLSADQQDEILAKEDAEEYKERLSAVRDKIVQGIARNNERSGERAIWELMQNARDLSDAAITKIVLSQNSIVFYHKGEPFNLKTLRNLIMHIPEDTRSVFPTIPVHLKCSCPSLAKLILFS